MRLNDEKLARMVPFGCWGYHAKGTTVTTLCRTYRFQMIANNAKRGAPLHLLVFASAAKLSPETLALVQAGACFRAIGRIELWPSNNYGVADHPPHLFVTQPIGIDEYWLEHHKAP